MQAPHRPGTPTSDPAGGRDEGGTWRPSWGWLAVALGILAGSLGYFGWWWLSTPAPGTVAGDTGTTAATPTVAMGSATPAAPLLAAASDSRPPLATTAQQSRQADTATQRIVRTRDPSGDLTPDLADYVNEGERPTMAEVIERLHQAGVHSGLGAFSPPGTRPPLVGLAVPEDFPLPEGYVRHYQATDDGQRIEPILMFSPDHRFVDAAGRPVEIPKDRVVPPELAPPGLPMRRIVIPAPAAPGGPGS